MEHELKELLLKDLTARLPYGVVCTDNRHGVSKVTEIDTESGVVYLFDVDEYVSVEVCHPYLRPMSSMTEEERKDILQSLNIHGDIDNEGNLLLGVECDIITLKVCKKYLGELNKRMFDVCHMIEKGLALEAPKGMY